VPCWRSTGFQTKVVPCCEGNDLRAAAPGWLPGMIEGKYGAVPPLQESCAGWHCTMEAGVATVKPPWAAAKPATATA